MTYKSIIAIAFVATLFSACKKDYTCTCTTAGSSTPDIVKIIGVNKKTATANCVSKTTTSTSGTLTTVDVTTCTLSN